MIKFNVVTWYSKLAAIIFFIGVLPAITFYIGMRFQEVKDINHQLESALVASLSTNTKTQKTTGVDTSGMSYEGWNTYTNKTYGYTVKYPEGWHVDTKYSNQPYEVREGEPSVAMGGDTYISNYSSEELDEFQSEEDGGFDLPSDYMVVDIMFEKGKSSDTLIDYLKSRMESGLPKTLPPETNLTGTPAVRYDIKDIQGIGGNTKPNSVTVISKNKEHIVSIGYGYRDTDAKLVPTAEMIVNSFAFSD